MWIKKFYNQLLYNNYWVEEVKILKETEKAYLFEFCGQKQWYPKSKVFKIDKKTSKGR